MCSICGAGWTSQHTFCIALEYVKARGGRAEQRHNFAGTHGQSMMNVEKS